MNIQFTLTVHTFAEAAVMEKALTDNNLKYKFVVEDKPSLGAARAQKRHNLFPRINRQRLDDISGYLNVHPDMSYVIIGEKFNVHQQTVSKISRGVHPMQKNKPNGEDKVEPEVEPEVHREYSGAKPLRRTPITKSELAAVVSTIASNQYASNAGIANKCGVSAPTVARIRSGTHPLQIDGSAE